MKITDSVSVHNDVRLMVYIMTNRELYTLYETTTDTRHFVALTEMAHRLHKSMIDDSVPRLFRQYKLNGAGDERK